MDRYVLAYSYNKETTSDVLGNILKTFLNRLFKKYKCDIIMAMGMAGHKPIDKQCSHEATLGLQEVQLFENKHILEVFVHMDEAKNDKEIYKIAKNRTEKHALNAIALLKSKTNLTKNAGKGIRQGKKDEGPIKI